MGNLGVGIKKFLSNKNTVTVVGVIVAVVVLYVAYNLRVQAAVNPISVPYAREQINPGVQITEDMVGTMEVPPSMLEGDVITNQADVIDKYSNADTLIPQGSLFYSRQVVEKEQLPANIILDYPKGYVLSKDSITLHYENKKFSISPYDQKGFINELTKHNPYIKVISVGS